MNGLLASWVVPETSAKNIENRPPAIHLNTYNPLVGATKYPFQFWPVA